MFMPFSLSQALLLPLPLRLMDGASRIECAEISNENAWMDLAYPYISHNQLRSIAHRITSLFVAVKSHRDYVIHIQTQYI